MLHHLSNAGWALYGAVSPATACLALALALGAFAYGVLRRWTTVALLPASMAAVAVVVLSLGRPLPMTPPPGDYQVLGAKIVVDVAIYALLDDGTTATYYVLPYSTSAANDLQAAQDGEGGASASVGEDGGVAYDGEPPVQGDAAKEPEAPAYSVGG
ncbi:hypothetical protein LB521_27620 [Mesorhizobium sp. BR-1-1-8]|uniref:hypothetical protein n=1 Tax=Mesorhizobium sp. BR-1-1-8 TaxID=2876659 RepID=UPI001CC9A65B|nr:hypothetical protein [Mesorhizobium sp. BR-1-1-8]MBZ9984906.1 hypothetical protein [Mesorhizobium sp. BR-1-1-8]